MIWILLLSFILPVQAGFNELNETELYQYQGTPTPVKSKVINPATADRVKKIPSRSKRPTNSELDRLANQIMKEDRLIGELLGRQERSLILRKHDDRIPALTRIKGTVLNSVLAMNIKPAKFVVRLSNDNELLNGGEIRCLGHSFEKRIPARCDLLVLNDKEFEVDIDIWDLDGAEGIIADYYYSGEEKAFLTSSFAAFMQGVLDVAKDRVATPFGDVERSNAKNKVMGGLMGVAGNVQDKVGESADKNLSIAYANSGKQVLVFFNQGLSFKKGDEQ